MLSFESDYIQGAHEQILKRLAETNREPLSGYGNDKYCESAKEKIRQACGCREAVVFPKKNMPAHFLTLVKQKGGLLAKGRLLGVQFDTLFTDDLYFRISAHAIEMAEKMKEMFQKKGKRFFLDSPTNQQFLILENGEMARLKEQVNFDIWERYDEGHTVVRFATSWATEPEDAEKLREIMLSGGQ